MKAIDRFYMYLAEKSLKPTAIEKEIGLSNGYLSAQKKRNADIGEGVILKIIDYFRDINLIWLLTGEGLMINDSKTSEESSTSAVPNAVSISPAEESIIYKMYKEKDAEVGALKEEIGALKLRISQLEAQNKKTELQSKESEFLEGFTSESYGDYGESSLPTKQPIVSKRSSAGKI